MDQRSAHQNGVIAIKRWEKSVKEFLEKPLKKSQDTHWDEDIRENNREKDEQKSWEKIFHHTTPETHLSMLKNKQHSLKENQYTNT